MPSLSTSVIYRVPQGTSGDVFYAVSSNGVDYTSYTTLHGARIEHGYAMPVHAVQSEEAFRAMTGT